MGEHAARWLIIASFCALVAAQQGTASTGKRDFPADVKFEEWGNGAGQTYAQQLAVQSGGAGIGLGFLFTLLMFFHMCCWGFCCNCCRCCCFKSDVVQERACWREKSYHKYFGISAVVIFVISVIGVIVIFTSQSTLYTRIDTAYDNVGTVLMDYEDFHCKGSVPERLRSGESLESIKGSTGGTTQTLGLCASGSVGRFLYDSNVKVNSTFEGIVTLIDNMEGILTSLDAAINLVATADSIAVSINNTVFKMDNQSDFIVAVLGDLLATSTNFSAYVPATSDIPTVDSTDKTYPTVTSTALSEVSSSLTTARNEVASPINSLVNTTRKELVSNWNKIITELVKIDNQLLDQVDKAVKAEKDVDDSQESTGSTESIGKLILALVYSISCISLIFMLAGWFFSKRWPMCLGAYTILLLFMWLCLILGLFLILTMVTYDTCGCEGDYTQEGCKTLWTLLETNVGSTKYNINGQEVVLAAVIKNIFTCGVSESANGTYMYTPETNFVDVLNVLPAFNFSKDTAKSRNQLLSSVDQLNVTSSINQAVQYATQGMNSMAQVSVAANYNFTYDVQRYNYLKSELQNPTRAPTYYPTFSAATNLQNIVRLTELTTTTYDFSSAYDTLESNKTSFNVTTLDIESQAQDIDTRVQNAQTSVRNSNQDLVDLIDFILSINRYTPCAIAGNAWRNIVVGDFCKNTYVTLDEVVPGAILCLMAMILGLFLMAMMRECVVMEQQNVSMVEIDVKSPEPAQMDIITSPAQGQSIATGAVMPMSVGGTSSATNYGKGDYTPAPAISPQANSPSVPDDYNKPPVISSQVV